MGRTGVFHGDKLCLAKKKVKLLTSTVFHWDNGKDETTYDHWMNGAADNGYAQEVAQRIWDDVLEFAQQNCYEPSRSS